MLKSTIAQLQASLMVCAAFVCYRFAWSSYQVLKKHAKAICCATRARRTRKQGRRREINSNFDPTTNWVG